MVSLNKYQPYAYFAFRVLVGILFFLHGAQKLFGWFGKGLMDLFSLMGLAGIIEVVAGLAITVGLFTRALAAFSAVEMIVAYFMAHVSKGIVPLVNGGEPAVLFFAAFLVLVTYGSGTWNLEHLFFGRSL